MDDQTKAELEDDLTKFVRLVTDTPSPVGNAFNREFKKHAITISDVRIVVEAGDRRSVIGNLIDENRRLRDEIHLIKGVRITWTDFVTACAERIDINQRSWKALVAKHLKCSLGELSDYQRNDRVPMVIMKGVAKLPDLRQDERKNRRKNLDKIVTGLVSGLRHGRVNNTQIAFLLTQLLEIGDAEGLPLALESAIAGHTSEEPLFKADSTEGSALTALPITAKIGPRRMTPVIESYAVGLARRILKSGELDAGDPQASTKAMTALIRDGWIFQVGPRLMAFHRHHEFPDAWDAAGKLRSHFTDAHRSVLEALERHQQDHPEGITLPEWDRITWDANGKRQRGGVNSMVSDFQRRRRGKGIVTITGDSAKTRWRVRPDWRDG